MKLDDNSYSDEGILVQLSDTSLQFLFCIMFEKLILNSLI